MPRLLMEQPPEVVGQPRATPDSMGAGVGAEMAYLGRQSQALGQVIGQYVESDARARAVHYETALSAELQQISLDPDIPGRTARFESAQRRLLDQYRPKMGGQSTYDAKAGLATMDLGARFQHATAVDAISEARRNTTLAANSAAMRAAMATDDEEAIAHFLDAKESIEAASNYFTPAEKEIALRDVVGSGIRAMADTNPKMALRQIDRLGSMLPVEVTAVYRSEAIANIQAAASREVSEASQERKLRLQAETDRSHSAEDRLVDLDREGKLTLDAVQAEKDLSPSAYKRMKLLATGGTSGSAKPDVYIELSDRASAGEDVVELANEAMSRGDLFRTERDSIVKTSRDERFEVNRARVKETLNPGAFSSDTKMRAKRTRAMKAFDDWVRENPHATYEEAEAKADAVIDAATTKLPGLQFMANAIKSQDDIDAMIEKVQLQAAQQIIDQAEADTRYKQLEAISREIETRAALTGGKGAE